jgi:hypothetical protein
MKYDPVGAIVLAIYPTTRFTVLYEPSKDGGYVVTGPALPAVVTQGDTLEEARAMASWSRWTRRPNPRRVLEMFPFKNDGRADSSIQESALHIPAMAHFELSDEEREVPTRHLREHIANTRFPSAPVLRPLKSVPTKLDP